MVWGDMWAKYSPSTTMACNVSSPNFTNYKPYELVFGRKLKLLLDLETHPDIKVSGKYKDYYKQKVTVFHKLFRGMK